MGLGGRDRERERLILKNQFTSFSEMAGGKSKINRANWLDGESGKN